jgi:hypothetical protein
LGRDYNRKQFPFEKLAACCSPQIGDTAVEKRCSLIIDDRKVNAKTVGENYPNSRRYRYFSSVVSVKIFFFYRHGNVIPSERKGGRDRSLTDFSTKEDHWEYKRLQF